MAAREDAQAPVPLELSCRVGPGGEVVVDLGGELDIVSAEAAVSYVSDVTDRCRGPVVVDLKAIVFCDARGLAALLRMAGHAESAGCEFRLASPTAVAGQDHADHGFGPQVARLPGHPARLILERAPTMNEGAMA